MGLRPTRDNENRRCRPRESGDPLSVQWIPVPPLSRRTSFAGMTCPGVIFRRAAGDEEFRITLSTSRARFLAALGMTAWAHCFPQPAKVKVCT